MGKQKRNDRKTTSPPTIRYSNKNLKPQPPQPEGNKEKALRAKCQKRSVVRKQNTLSFSSGLGQGSPLCGIFSIFAYTN